MSVYINPDDFIIVRKRKKYRFALFNNSPLCFELAEWGKTADIDVIEVGAGNGFFLVELARRYPGKEFVALDVKGDRLQNGAHRAAELGLKNIRFVRARADQLDQVCMPHSVASVWLTFSDPFPRQRSAGRRLTHPTFLSIYATLLSPGGDVLIKHDNRDFFCWSLEQLVAQQWRIVTLSFNVHESNLPDDYKILTSYEARWLDEGRTTQFVQAVCPSNGVGSQL